MKKFILVSLLIVAVAGISIGAFSWLNQPQVINLGNGTKLTFLGVTYGKHHVAPKVRVGGKTRGGGARLDTTNDTLVVWVQAEHRPNDYPNYDLVVSDVDHTGCAATWSNMRTQARNGVDIQGFTLNAYPRWDRKIVLHARSWNNDQRLSKDQFVISNPARTSLPKWTADAMPDTQTDDDLAVTLTRFVYGMHGFGPDRGPANDPANQAVLTEFHVEQKGVAVTNWEPVRITTTDASGNHSEPNSWSQSHTDNGNVTMTYQWGLWPQRAPWRLRVEMTKASGFDDSELWKVTAVPVKAGNWNDLYNGGRNRAVPSPAAETTIGGIHLQLTPVIAMTNQNRGNGEHPGGIRIQADQPLDGWQISIVKATDENGREIGFYNGYYWGTGDSRQIQLRNLRNATTVDLTFAVRKSRFFEFTAVPSKPSPADTHP